MFKKIKDLLPLCLFTAYFLKIFIQEPSQYDGIVLGICAMSAFLFEALRQNAEKQAKAVEERANNLELLQEDIKNLKIHAKRSEEEINKVRGDINGIKVSRVIK